MIELRGVEQTAFCRDHLGSDGVQIALVLRFKSWCDVMLVVLRAFGLCARQVTLVARHRIPKLAMMSFDCRLLPPIALRRLPEMATNHEHIPTGLIK